MNLKRDLVKYVRDKAKSKYDKGTECQICGSKENLDFHHFYGMTELLDKWLRENKLNIDSAEEIMEVRDTFIEQHIAELYEEAVTLCHSVEVMKVQVFCNSANVTFRLFFIFRLGFVTNILN